MSALANASDDLLLIKEKLTNKLRYQLMVTSVCHFVWGVIHLVFNLTDRGHVYPHMFITFISGIGYYAGKLIRVHIYLRKLGVEINRRHLVKGDLTVWDCLEVLATGISVGLVIGGAAEVLDKVIGFHSSGAK